MTHQYRVGDRVGFKAIFDPSGASYPGVITRTHQDGSFEVEYDNGCVEREEARDLAPLPNHPAPPALATRSSPARLVTEDRPALRRRSA